MQGDQNILGLSPDLSREEKVSFVGKINHPLVFRDAMLMLREIVISDMRRTKKDRKDFFEWLNKEIDRRIGQAYRIAGEHPESEEGVYRR